MMQKARIADRLTHVVTRSLHRVHRRFPVVKSWPGGKRVRADVSVLLRPIVDPIVMRAARVHRRRLSHTTFIGITGSAGKTSTKFLLGAVLSSMFEGRYTPGTQNKPRNVARSLLRYARQGDSFHIVEFSAGAPGLIDEHLRLVRPQVCVVTNIGTDHYAAYGSIGAIAQEKSKAVKGLPGDATAILNADDSRVLGMKSLCSGRVITFGTSEGTDVRAHNVSARWPDRLAFDVVFEGSTAHVEMQLCGTLWVSSALAAIATGLALGVPLQRACDALSQVPPNPGRMSPEVLPDGVTFIRDDWKASVHTIPPALEFMREARANRKIVVLGTIADTMGDAGGIYVNTARHALDVADVVCFVGPRAFAAMRAAPHDRPDRLRAFSGVAAAHEFLTSFLRAGDLVLLKGSNASDHLSRLSLARTGVVTCWRMDCGRMTACINCELLRRPSHAPGTPSPVIDTPADSLPRFDPDTVAAVLIGLGNPGEQHAGTPHNIGHAAVDRLATRAGVPWESGGKAAIATLEWNGKRVWLVKPHGMMNLLGRTVHGLAEQLGFRPEHCVLLYDDMDLPLGTVRTRMRGSDGGHRGVRSILEAFQSDQFPRVKIGVRRPSDAGAARDAVLKPFQPEDRVLIETALQEAEKRLRVLVTERRGTTPAPEADVKA